MDSGPRIVQAKSLDSDWELSSSARWAWLCAPLLVFGAMWLLEPGVDRQLWLRWLALPLPETCSTYTALGIDCPGCGLTRSFVHLSRGNWQIAWGLNPMGPLLYAYLLVQIPLAAMRWIPNAPSHQWFARLRVKQWATVNQWIGFGLAIGLLLLWVVKLVWRAYI